MSAHLDSLLLRLSHERARLTQARSPGEAALRGVWVQQLEREVAGEQERRPDELTADELFDALKEGL